MLQMDEYSRVPMVPHPLMRASPLSFSAEGSSAFHTPLPTVFVATSSNQQQDAYANMLHQGASEGHELLTRGVLAVDPALREEVSAVQLELQKQIFVLQQEQQMQQKILLQHFQLQQRHLQQQHEQHLSERIRRFMENQQFRRNSSTHSDEDRDSDNGSDKELTANCHELEKELIVVDSPTSNAIKCPKKDVLRKLEEEERMRHLTTSKSAKVVTSKGSVSLLPKIVMSSKKSCSGVSLEVRAKLQHFLTKRQEQKFRTKQISGAAQRARQKSSSSEGSTTSSLSGTESPPAMTVAPLGSTATPSTAIEELFAEKPVSSEHSLKPKCSLRQKRPEGRPSRISSKAEQKSKQTELPHYNVALDEQGCQPSGGSQELPKQKKNEMFQMISMLMGQ